MEKKKTRIVEKKKNIVVTMTLIKVHKMKNRLRKIRIVEKK